MRVVVQRVNNASVSVNEKIVAAIEQGYLLLVAFKNTDTLEEVHKCAKKIARLRIFSDQDDKLNLSITDISGSILSVSQFTLYGNMKKTNRPSFTSAKNFNEALSYYREFNRVLREEYKLKVLEGVFGENMQVSLVNDGPVTILIDTDEL